MIYETDTKGKTMRFLIWLFFFALFMIFLMSVIADVAHAGTSLKNLSQTTNFIEVSSSPIHPFTVLEQMQEIKRHADLKVPYKALIEATVDMIKYDQQQYEKFDRLFPDYILDNTRQSQALELSRKADEAMEIVPHKKELYDIYRIGMKLIDKHFKGGDIRPEVEELKKMKRILADAREASQRIMSKAEIHALLEACDNHRFEEASRIMDVIIARVSSSPIGASFECSSYVIN